MIFYYKFIITCAHQSKNVVAMCSRYSTLHTYIHILIIWLSQTSIPYTLPVHMYSVNESTRSGNGWPIIEINTLKFEAIEWNYIMNTVNRNQLKFYWFFSFLSELDWIEFYTMLTYINDIQRYTFLERIVWIKKKKNYPLEDCNLIENDKIIDTIDIDCLQLQQCQ